MWKSFSLAECWKLQWKILTLTATREDFLNMKAAVLPWGLFFTLMAGIGRAWDDSSAELIMRSGLPSVAYIFRTFWFSLHVHRAIAPEELVIQKTIDTGFDDGTSRAALRYSARDDDET